VQGTVRASWQFLYGTNNWSYFPLLNTSILLGPLTFLSSGNAHYVFFGGKLKIGKSKNACYKMYSVCSSVLRLFDSIPEQSIKHDPASSAALAASGKHMWPLEITFSPGKVCLGFGTMIQELKSNPQ
jgi:hypothetical protein